MKNSIKLIIGTAACLLAAGAAYAAVILDDTGVGFVGKGDVQLALDWNNKQLQSAVEAEKISFRINQMTTTSTTTSWTCTNPSDDTKTQERNNTTTTTASISGVYNSTARLKSQVTGFNLNGWDGDPVIVPATTKNVGPAVGSCPAKWTASENMVEEGETTNTGGLEVSGDGGTTWVIIPQTL